MTAQRWHELDYVVVDVEGNGGRPPALVEVAVVPIRAGRIGEPQSWLVRPPTGITWQARRIHGISDPDVADAPTIEEMSDDVLTALGARDARPPAVVGHNVHVDLDVLTRSLAGWRPAVAFDTLRLARRLWDLSSFRLGALVESRHLDQDLPAGLRPHRAGYDALVTARLFVDLTASASPDGLSITELREHALAAGFAPDGSRLPVRRPTADGPTLFELP